MNPLKRFRSWILLLVAVLLGGCTPLSHEAVDPLAALCRPDGKAVWQDEYLFDPPQKPWALLQLDESDYSVAFYKGCGDYDPGSFPCEATFAYGEEPFGYSQDLEQRAAEFFKRFLWAARIQFSPPRLQPAQVLGGEGLVAFAEGIEPVQKHKIRCKVVFAKRGERVVGFYLTQWRPENGVFDPADEQAFDRFVQSFQFLKPSFYEML